MRNFNLSITSYGLPHSITILDEFPCGWHQNLSIVDFHGDPRILKQILFKHKSSLSNISIASTAVWNANSFAMCFGALGNLRRLKLESCQLNEGDEVSAERKFDYFPMLRELKIVKCDYAILDVFKGCKVRLLFKFKH